MDSFEKLSDQMIAALTAALTSTDFYVQAAAIGAAVFVGVIVSAIIRGQVTFFRQEPAEGRLVEVRRVFFRAQRLLTPFLIVLLLGVAEVGAARYDIGVWLIRIAEGLAVIALIYAFAHSFIRDRTILKLISWVGIPLALLEVFDLLDDVNAYLDGIAIGSGNINVSLGSILRALIFGVILFWLGRISNTSGKRVIRSQQQLDAGTREVVAKLFEIVLFFVIGLLLLQIIGIDLTALAVFGGALGVGLGFGLQQIAANFISGIIILLDRSLTIGDFVELEDGRSGYIRELTMRSALIETFEGKHVMVPNEIFMTTSFTNWTHYDKKQRYPLHFSVAYSTDIPEMLDIIRDVVKKHPQVLSGPDYPIEEQPDAEIESFGDHGINILVEFWMEGVDDGPNHVGADLLLMIWMALKEHNIEIPFPQREVRILGEKGPLT